jgi:uncharacterized protein
MLRRMALIKDIITSRYYITGYEDDSVKINETTYKTSLVLSADTLHNPWPFKTVSNLDETGLQVILDLKPDVVLLGTGKRQQFPTAKIFAEFGQRGIGLEVMDNGGLCRTFNILVAEDRSVVAAILLGE